MLWKLDKVLRKSNYTFSAMSLRGKLGTYLPVCKRWQGARCDFQGRQNSAPNQGAERPGAAQCLFPNGIIVPGAAHLPSFSHLCPKISQSCPDFCPDCESYPNKILSKAATFFSLAYLPRTKLKCYHSMLPFSRGEKSNMCAILCPHSVESNKNFKNLGSSSIKSA